ncbi:MAG: hypothetical protein RIT81_20705 [Deltaproteobacteria bacterium]
MLRPLLCSLLLTSAACVAAPYNNTQVGNEQQTINFRGYWLAAGSQMQILASANPNGPFTQIATAVTGTDGYTYPDGLTVYFFEAAITVPAQYWSGDECTGRQTFLRAKNGPVWTVPSLDAIAPSGESPYTCIQTRVNNGWSTIDAVNYCKSPDSPNVRLFTGASTGPSAYIGNVTIATAADEKYWSCLETLQGNMTVSTLSPDDVSLPRLQQINGDLSVVYDRFPLTSGEEASYLFEVPNLTTITGDFVVTSPAITPGYWGRVALGLDGLTTLQGDLQIQIDAGNVSLTGLSALNAVGGDLIFDGGTGDADMDQFATVLTQVGGDLEVDAGNNVQQLLRTLQTVGGDFRHLDGNPYATGSATDSYRDLQSVGGDLVLQDGVVQGPGTFPLMPNLTSIGATLEYRQMNGPTSLRVGGRGLSVGGLLVENNSALITFGGSNTSVDPTGPIQVINNPNLCVSTINAFVAGQSGWTGTLTQSGNDTGC